MMSREAWLKEIFAILTERYHHRHPFQILLQNGKLNHAQLQAWALNRYYYQSQIPIKDAIILDKLKDNKLHAAWRIRLIEQAGDNTQPGGIERWLYLTTALNLPRDYVQSCTGLLPATRFAVNSYIHFVKNASILSAIASSLTEMSARQLIEVRMKGMITHYDFIDEQTLSYFSERLKQNDGKSTVAMNYIMKHAKTVEQVEAVLHAVQFKCDVLWSQSDALYAAYVEPGLIPPGAFDPLVQPNSKFQLPSGIVLEVPFKRLQGPERSFELSDTAFIFVKALDGKRSLSDILSDLYHHYPNQKKRIQQDVFSLCQTLLNQGFIRAC
ncbi:pyrroloquinoline-quinone synthase PqqC [Legionella yabuuchiae]|uniref:pyrroloquinoline-quinone synthase PqqC n=1 Tax=Legionella yabuuchiae TaxID=376727 RepID=UPI0013EF9677|nr:pyrroloquinoline-quinone synthase PqqC [Legionella yabuuchiae]